MGTSGDGARKPYSCNRRRVRPVWVAAALSIGFISCGGNPVAPSDGRTRVAPNSPTPQTGSSPEPSAPIPFGVGRVLEYTSSGLLGPVPNLRLTVWRPGTIDGRIGSTSLGDMTTDENGRFALVDPPPLFFIETAAGSDYQTICPAYPMTSGGLNRDVVPVVRIA